VADELTAQLDNGVLTELVGTGHASIEQTTNTGVRQTTSGDRLEAQFAAPQAGNQRAPKTTSGGPVAPSQVQSAMLDGHVALVQEPAQKPGGQPEAPMHATAGHATYASQGQWLHLTLSPRVEDGGLQLTANRVDVSQESGDAFAHGNVKASWMGQQNGSAGGQHPAGPGFAGQGPAHAVAAEAKLHQSNGEATFTGQARLWQQANSVSAPVIVLDRQRQTLLARTTDPTQPVRAVLLSASGAAVAKEANGKPSGLSVVRIHGGELRYSDGERKATMWSGVMGTVVAETGMATSVSQEVELILLPPGNHAGKDGGAAQVDRMIARGSVTITSQGRRGTGEQLEYAGETAEYTLTGTAAAPPKMTDPIRGVVSGDALIFHGRDDSVSIEGGLHRTSTETTAPK
jgi:lipopolysaccharide export system protein LptA